MTSSGRTVANGGMAISGNNVKDFGSGRIIDNQGVATWSGTGSIRTGLDGVFNNLPGATLDAQSDSSFSLSLGGTALFNNQGTFRKSAGSGATVFSVPFDNSGSVEAFSGTLSFNAGYSQAAGSTRMAGGNITASIVDILAGNLTGSGTITGALAVTGSLQPGGSAAIGEIVVTGNYTQSGVGQMTVELAGAGQGEYDVLTVTSLATIGGTLDIVLIDGFQPVLGQIFEILLYGSRGGEFDNITGLEIGGGLRLEVTYLSDRLRVEVVSAP